VGGGGDPLTSKDIVPLAQLLYVLLPNPTITGGLGDATRQHQVSDRLIAACRMAGIEAQDATVIGEALAGYLYGWGSRHETLADMIDRAQTALNAAAGGAGHARVRWLPMGNPLTVSAIAHLLAWVLALECEGDEA
jgi:hypothetical protein